MLQLPDGPGWSPDGGEFWVKGNLLYWSNGSIWDMTDGGAIRTMTLVHENDYSALTDEARAELVAKCEKQRAEYAEKQRKEFEANEVLRTSARLKLTEDEYYAVLLEGRE